MAITKAFMDDVRTGDILGVHISMKDSVLRDPTFEEFRAMERAAKDMDGLYVPHDGRELNQNRSEWDDDYMAKIQAQLITNFSHERVEHLKEIVTYLHPIDDPARPHSSKHPADSKTIQTWTMVGCSTAGLAVGVGTAAILHASAIGGVALGVGGVVAGAIVGVAIGERITGGKK